MKTMSGRGRDGDLTTTTEERTGTGSGIENTGRGNGNGRGTEKTEIKTTDERENGKVVQEDTENGIRKETEGTKNTIETEKESKIGAEVEAGETIDMIEREEIEEAEGRGKARALWTRFMPILR